MSAANRPGFPADLTSGKSATHLIRLSAELSARLDKISRNSADALHVVFAAALAALLGRYTRQDEVLIGIPGPEGTSRQLRTDPAGALRDLLPRVGAAVKDAEPGEDFDVAVSMNDPRFAPGASTRFVVSHDGDALLVALNASHLSESSIQRLATQYELLLNGLTQEPDKQASEIGLSTLEDEAIIAASNDTARAFAERATIHGLFAAQVARTPDAPALLTAQRPISYAELDARSNQLAHTVRARGAGPGDIVALLVQRGPEMMAAVLAVLKTGAAYLPIDPSYPQARIDYLLEDSAAQIVLAQKEFVDLVPDAIDVDDPASYSDSATPVANGGPRDVAYVIYTSGSTGRPKGVLVEHRSVVNRLAWMQNAYPIAPGDVILQKTSISFDVSVWELFWWSFNGAALALLEPGEEKDPAKIVAAIDRHGVSTMHFVPSMLTLFLGHLDRFAAPLTSLRQVFASGEALTPSQVTAFERLVPAAALVNLYGPTEATVDVTHQPTAGLGERARVPIGRPIDNTRMYVLDDHGNPAPVGVPGELHAAGVGVARGYLNRPELTAEKFVAGSGVGEERLYRTGDLARWLSDGTIDYLGRVDLQVKVRGFRVEPGEIEERLRAHADVDDAAVVAVDDGWQTSLRGFVVANSEITEAALKQHVRDALPEYMVPGRIVVLDELPLTPNGKLDRAALTRPEALRRKAPSHVEPRTEAERVLAGIWREVLGKDKISVQDNFFVLGGNSIHFVSVLAQAREAGLTFTFQQLFKHQTIAALAASIEQEVVTTDVAARGGFQPFELISAEDRAKLPADAEDAYPLSMLQAGLIFQTEITGGLGQYHDVLSYSLTGELDATAFTEAVRQLTLRHPILRTTYHLTGYSEFLQVVHRDVRPPLSIEDLRGLDADAQAEWHEHWLAAEKSRRFVWEQGELVTLHVQVLSDERYRYTVSQHNSALDGWSISLLHTQLFELYHAIREGRTVEREPVDNHLRNFVGLEGEALRSPKSKDFWLKVLDGSESTNVPREAGAVDTTDFQVVLRDVELPDGLTERITALADSLSVPFKDVLLAAHMKVLALVSGQRSVMTGYEHSGRPELPGAETTLGLHLNSVPFLVEVADGSWADLVRQVYRAELDLLPHRRYPMAKMKQDLGTQRILFDTTFNFTHFYLMKELQQLPEFSLLDMRVDSETEFTFRTEFSRHFFDDQVRLCLHFHTHLYSEERIDRIGGYFARVLELMVSAPDTSHNAHDLLAPADRALLTTRCREGHLHEPEVSEGGLHDTLRAGSQPVVDQIAAAWAEVLSLAPDEIGRSDDFFALGGNSLSALRVVLELDGLVTLSDLTSTPRLGELAGVVEHRLRPEAELLHLLSAKADGRAAVICVPYPCGHPINFRPLAESLEAIDPEVVVWGLEQPGHDPVHGGEFASIEETASLVVAEIEKKADLPIILWGHCGGAAVTVELARVLEERGFDLRHVFIGSKLLPPASDMRESIEMIDGWSDEQIIRYMVEETGYAELDGLPEAHTSFVGSLFRNDVCNGYRYFIEHSVTPPSWKIEAPFTVVVADDDPGLTHAADEYQKWDLVASDVRFHRLADGGHYFVRTNTAGTGELIVGEL